MPSELPLPIHRQDVHNGNLQRVKHVPVGWFHWIHDAVQAGVPQVSFHLSPIFVPPAIRLFRYQSWYILLGVVSGGVRPDKNQRRWKYRPILWDKLKTMVRRLKSFGTMPSPTCMYTCITVQVCIYNTTHEEDFRGYNRIANFEKIYFTYLLCAKFQPIILMLRTKKKFIVS